MSNLNNPNPYLPERVKVLEKTFETSDVFRLRMAFRSDYRPGQFLQIGLPGYGEAPISISSFSKNYVEMHIRAVGNVTNALGKLNAGDYVFVRGPYGNGFPVELLGKTGLIFIGGGCGVAPLKSVIDYMEMEKPGFSDVHVFFGFKRPEEIIMKEKIARWESRFRVKLSVDENPSRAEFSGKTGFVTELVKEFRPDGLDYTVLMCGPPVMMKKSMELLLAKGFRRDQIYLSTERLMKCGVGVCGHCMIRGKYTCKDGPIFRADELDVLEVE